MSPLRLWILAVALGSFAAGMVLGIALPDVLTRPTAAATPEQGYVSEMAQRYGLSAAQQRSVRLILQHRREQELEILSSAELNQLPQGLQNRWLAAQSMTERRIRAVLDEQQLALYERDSRPLPNALGRLGTSADREHR